MATYRCPKDDIVFETSTDDRKPGAVASKDGRFPAHPENGHPDCPLCMDRAVADVTKIPPTRDGGRAATKSVTF